ncbi:MAG: dihydrodipicolinate synthase family protein [Isosphaeraceae bacterium]|jgi:4-hydroxy-tetrahydrodipicolinate synthase|nr:MAG: dihydrodipicolinate synthase family protein [Isosphaeraceae bacterium]
MKWDGVFPAMTTPFRGDLEIDHGFLAEHARWLVDQGSSGLVVLGSLGEGATLTGDEKRAVIETVVGAVGDRVPVVAGIAALSTAEAVGLARMAEAAGCRGLMVLPPYVYVGDWRETKAHVGAVLRATRLSCMLYNNPIAYRTDFVPEQIAELAAEYAQLEAVKESSADVRRITAIRELVGERLALFVGVDDLIVEGVEAGAVGWVAGLVNALPRESVALFERARAGQRTEAWELYRWFLPLLRMDTVPTFVQRIKLVQQEVGMGHERVRPPRLELDGGEREECLRVVRAALRTRPRV